MELNIIERLIKAKIELESLEETLQLLIDIQKAKGENK